MSKETQIQNEHLHASLSRTSMEINAILEKQNSKKKSYEIFTDGTKIEIIYTSNKSKDNQSHFSLEINLYQKYRPQENNFYQTKNCLYEYGKDGLSRVGTNILFNNKNPELPTKEVSQEEIEKVDRYLQHIKSTLLLTKSL